MKKTALIFMLLLICSMAYSIELYSFGTLSYDYAKVSVNCDPESEWFNAVLGSGIEQDVWKLTLFAEVGLETEMSFSGMNDGSFERILFKPTHQNYYVRGGVWFENVYLTYEHLCMHNVDSVDYTRNGGYDRVTVGFDTRGRK